MLACSAIAPATAHAALLEAVDTGAATAVPAQRAADVVRAVGSAANAGTGAVTRPATGSGDAPARPLANAETPSAPGPGAVDQVVAPVSAATGAPVGSGGASAGRGGRLREHGRARVSRISASAAAAERLSAARAGHAHDAAAELGAAAGARDTAQHSVAAPHRESVHSASENMARPASSRGLAAPEPSSGLAGADGAVGGSSGFSFGGGLALLVAALLLAGPRLRRRLLLLPAVCRPAAFHVVLERPG